MSSCLRDIGCGHVDAEGGEPRPSLFEKIQSASGTTAHVNKPEAALITPGKYLVQRPQRLSPRSIRRSVKKYFDLRIVAPRRLERHPAAGLEMKILQIVTGPFAACFLALHLQVFAIFAAAVDAGQVREEHARSVEQPQQRTIMISGQGIDSGLDVGEVLQKQGYHVCVKASAVGHWRAGKCCSAPRALGRASTGHLGQLPHGRAVTEIPGNPWQLTGTVGEPGSEARDGTGHAVAQRFKSLTLNQYGRKKGMIHRCS